MSGDNTNAFIAIINNGGNTNALSPSSIMEIVLRLLSKMIILLVSPLSIMAVIITLLFPLSIMDTILTLLSIMMAALTLFPLSITTLITLVPLLRIALVLLPLLIMAVKASALCPLSKMAIIITLLSVTLFPQLSIMSTIQPI